MKTKIYEKRIISVKTANENAKKELKLLDGKIDRIDYRKKEG